MANAYKDAPMNPKLKRKKLLLVDKATNKISVWPANRAYDTTKFHIWEPGKAPEKGKKGKKVAVPAEQMVQRTGVYTGKKEKAGKTTKKD